MGLPVKAREAIARAQHRARDASQQGGLVANGVTLGAAFAAAAIDGKMGVGTSTYVGLVAAVAGYFMRQPMIVNGAVGLLAPAAYRYGGVLYTQYMAPAAAPPPAVP